MLKKGEEISGICILRTASRSNNNTWSPCVRGPSQNVALGSFTSCSGRRRKVQTCVMLMQSCCFAHKGCGFICIIPVKPSHLLAGILGPVHTYQGIFSLLSTRKRPFRAPKTQVTRKRSPEWTFKNVDFSFTCGRTKTEAF